MVRFVRWISLACIIIILFVMGRDAFHLKHTEEFFTFFYVLCLALALVFGLTGRVKKND